MITVNNREIAEQIKLRRGWNKIKKSILLSYGEVLICGLVWHGKKPMFEQFTALVVVNGIEMESTINQDLIKDYVTLHYSNTSSHFNTIYLATPTG